MPFYTFRTSDRGIKNKEFVVRMSFDEYDECMAGAGPVHPDTGKRCKKWERVLDNVNCNFAKPEESSRWDNFEYRAAHNLFKAQDQRRAAEQLSHVGATPYMDQERVDLETHDINNYEGKIV